MPDDERGRTSSATCATCRWWEGDGGDAWPWDGEADRGTGDWGYCARAEACAREEPPSLLLTTGYLRTESRFACLAWEPRDSGPQDAPESAQGCETPGRGLPSRGGPFTLTRAGVLCGQGDEG